MQPLRYRAPHVRLTQVKQPPTQSALDQLDHLLVIAPKKLTSRIWQSLPGHRSLQRATKRSGSKQPVSARLENPRATGVTLVRAPTEATTFATLTDARKWIAATRADRPINLGIYCVGFAVERSQSICAAALAACHAQALQLPQYKRTTPAKSALKRVKLFGGIDVDGAAIQATAAGNNLARWLTGQPPNALTAAAYRELVRELCKQHELAYEFISEAQLAKLGAGAFLAVSQGNRGRDAGIIRIRYRPQGKKRSQQGPAVALVGKGILFDTGGTNLKPFKGMLDMHADMQGSAVALGTLMAMAEMKVPYTADAWLAVTENRLAADSYKSQDVITAVNGKTIQIIHTDAEGRMVLADTLALACRTEPRLIIDYATLTGSCVQALGTRYSGVFSNRRAADQVLIAAGRRSGERVWPFPMDDDYDADLASDVADIKQCSPSAYADHILAARFLSEFVDEKIPWVHVDMSAGERAGGLGSVDTRFTGFGVRFTLDLLHDHPEGPTGLVQNLAN
jgi:leucyl aminopeptidase